MVSAPRGYNTSTHKILKSFFQLVTDSQWNISASMYHRRDCQVSIYMMDVMRRLTNGSNVSVSVQLSAQRTNSKIMAREIEELTANYTRVREDLCINNITVRELTANYTRFRKRLSFFEGELILSQKICTFNQNLINIWTFHGKLYFFSCDKLNWSSSRAFCVLKGADLVTITSQTEQRFLVSKTNEYHWIGLSDLETEGHWVWVNNQTLKETGVQFWHQRESEKSEPDNWKKEDPTGENYAASPSSTLPHEVPPTLLPVE
ncbi:uncharacterized protein [Garra rufa]|uniref:uncharacterized protein n=1 Tax=Garra rufa TaxID=137080 RepID=UPI003CCEC348